jgi:hypothetical protein
VSAACCAPAVWSRLCGLPVLLGLALLAACGGEEPERAPKALPGTPPEVEASLLTADDLGEEWVDLGPTPFEERGFDACPVTDVLAAEEDDRRVGEAQSYYSEGEPPAPTFFESVSLWDSSEVAAERLAVFATASEQCVGVPQETPDGRSGTATFTDRPAPQLGDEAVALTLEVQPEDGADLFLDLVAVRVGKAIVFTNGERYEDRPEESLDPSRLDELTAEAVEKVEHTLPG